MGERITVGELRNWLFRFSDNATVAFFVEGKGKDCTGNAFELQRIIEQPINGVSPDAGQSVVFLDLK